MSKPKLYTLRALLALEAAAAVVFMRTQTAIRLIPLLAAAWLAVEAANALQTKLAAMREHSSQFQGKLIDCAQ